MRADRSRIPEVGPDPVFRFPRIVRHVRDNGLEVRTVQHPTVPVVTVVLLVRGGLGADPAGQEGLAALTADMADEGTGAWSAIEVSDALARIGAEYDADVGADATVFTLTTLARFADRGARLLSDLTTRPSLRQDDFDRVRQLRLDRLTQLNDHPPAVAERAFLRLLYARHPYGHLAIGTGDSLRALNLDDVVRFHAATFQPARSTLVVAGPASHEALLAIGEAAFGGWIGNAAAALPAEAVGEPMATPPRLAIVPREGAAQSELRIGHLSARRSTPDYPALLVMNAVLGGQFVSRVNLRLREEKGYTYGAYSGLSAGRFKGTWSASTDVRSEVTEPALTDLMDELRQIRDITVPAKELADKKRSLVASFALSLESPQQVLNYYVTRWIYRLPADYWDKYPQRVMSVNAAQVQAMAKKYLDPKNVQIIAVGDGKKVEATLRKFGELEVFNTEGQKRIVP